MRKLTPRTGGAISHTRRREKCVNNPPPRSLPNPSRPIQDGRVGPAAHRSLKLPQISTAWPTRLFDEGHVVKVLFDGLVIKAKTAQQSEDYLLSALLPITECPGKFDA